MNSQIYLAFKYPSKSLGRKELAKNVCATGPGYLPVIINVQICLIYKQILLIPITELGMLDWTEILSSFGKSMLASPLSISAWEVDWISISIGV